MTPFAVPGLCRVTTQPAVRTNSPSLHVRNSSADKTPCSQSASAASIWARNKEAEGIEVDSSYIRLYRSKVAMLKMSNYDANCSIYMQTMVFYSRKIFPFNRGKSTMTYSPFIRYAGFHVS
jgi:hypothetical protein